MKVGRYPKHSDADAPKLHCQCFGQTRDGML